MAIFANSSYSYDNENARNEQVLDSRKARSWSKEKLNIKKQSNEHDKIEKMYILEE